MQKGVRVALFPTATNGVRTGTYKGGPGCAVCSGSNSHWVMELARKDPGKGSGKSLERNSRVWEGTWEFKLHAPQQEIE